MSVVLRDLMASSSRLAPYPAPKYVIRRRSDPFAGIFPRGRNIKRERHPRAALGDRQEVS